MKVFLDTNVLVAALATRGLCSEIFEQVIHDHELLTCQPVLAELKRVLAEKLRLPDPVIDGFLGLLESETQLVAPGQVPALRIRDPDNLAILACAVAGEADVFVTGDKELLDLRRVSDLAIISPRELWLRLMDVEDPGKPG